MVEAVKPEKGIWLPLSARHPQQAIKSRGTYRRVKDLTVLEQADPDRKLIGVGIGLSACMAAWFTRDPKELKAVIDKLMMCYDQMVGKGQSKVVSFGTEAKTWQDQE